MTAPVTLSWGNDNPFRDGVDLEVRVNGIVRDGFITHDAITAIEQRYGVRDRGALLLSIEEIIQNLLAATPDLTPVEISSYHVGRH